MPKRQARGNEQRVFDITLYFYHQTARAIKVATIPGAKSDECFWLPLSQIEIVERRGERITVTLPEWLIVEHGLESSVDP